MRNKLDEILKKASSDEEFSAKLKSHALAAGKSEDFGSSEWTELLRHFADSPRELAKLQRDMTGNGGEFPPQNTWTTLTTTTITSFPCTMTTTTTTTTMVAAKPGKGGGAKK